MATDGRPAPGTKTKLMAHFENKTRDQHNDSWSELWETKLNHFWDRGKPSPALIDFIEEHPEAQARRPSDRRPLALVPGCGKGYDVVMLALHGYDVYGLELSEIGLGEAKEHANAEFANPSAYNFGQSSKRPEVGSTKYIAGDFFSRQWEEQLEISEFNGFDLIYDYTFLCALLPDLRKDWAQRMKDLLSPSGILVCLEFPMYKDLKALGPPWGLNGVHWNLLAEGGDGKLDGTEPKASSGAVEHPGGSFKRIVYYQPSRTYEVGEGTDMLSVWVPKETV